MVVEKDHSFLIIILPWEPKQIIKRINRLVDLSERLVIGSPDHVYILVDDLLRSAEVIVDVVVNHFIQRFSENDNEESPMVSDVFIQYVW